MATPDFFRNRIDTMIDLRCPLAVLAGRMPWGEIEAALAPKFEHKDRAGQRVEGEDLLGRQWRWSVAAAAMQAGRRSRSV